MVIWEGKQHWIKDTPCHKGQESHLNTSPPAEGDARGQERQPEGLPGRARRVGSGKWCWERRPFAINFSWMNASGTQWNRPNMDTISWRIVGLVGFKIVTAEGLDFSIYELNITLPNTQNLLSRSHFQTKLRLCMPYSADSPVYPRRIFLVETFPWLSGENFCSLTSQIIMIN